MFIQYLSKLNENGTKLNLRFTDNQLLNNEKIFSLSKDMFIQYLSKLNENGTKLNLRFTESTLSAVKTFFSEKNKNEKILSLSKDIDLVHSILVQIE
ncbi:hypothetical protein BpHYR1_013935 [Brachionus plicatilis]|uniref:Uncharacterized protein n=1 Tax=Brachionus plicatilis TaxID=10195 RepID=A0A3M7QM01_BRAPC|nr:hypothetical protein BpHYR1_013935 [Brachionus plicatilis]